jgi:hypothetical protein
MITKNNDKNVKMKDLKWWLEQKKGVSTAQNTRESSINILGMNRKKELDLNYKRG